MNKRTVSLIVVVFLLCGVWLTQQALTRSTEDRSKAKELPELNTTVIPTPRSQLHAPFLRLATNVPGYRVGDQIPVDVYINTGGKPIVDVTTAINYDPKIFAVDPERITHVEQVFPVINIDQVSPGAMIFSLFLTDETGYTPVVTHEEVKIATVFFRVIGNGKETSEISLIHAGDPQTGMFVTVNKDTHEMKNVLETSEGVTVSIH